MRTTGTNPRGKWSPPRAIQAPYLPVHMTPRPLSGPCTRAGGNAVGAAGSRCCWRGPNPVPHSCLCSHHGVGVPFHTLWAPNRHPDPRLLPL